MAYSVDRCLKVADLVKTELAKLLLYRAGDPRFHHVTLTAVNVSRDLGHAKIFFSCVEENAKKFASVLNKASPYLRCLLSKNVSMRTVPKLYFVYDISLARGQHLAYLIDEVMAYEQQDNPHEKKEYGSVA